ncbi:S41 family peptidase [Candidatus Parcubacteria bacterium]|nr:S41 family peptidase [Candidatus Parcubacteria bacterium]
MQQSKKNRFWKTFFIFNLTILIIITSFVFGVVVGEETEKERGISNAGGLVLNKDELPDYLSKDADFNLFWEAWDIIQDSYIDRPISETKLLYGAIAGQVASLGDPYSIFMEPKTAEEFAQELTSEFEGIGAEIGIKNNILTIISPLPDSPAEKAGLKAGDKVYKIDDADTTYLSLDGAVRLIRGEAGTKVILTIFRDGQDETQKIEIVRGRIHYETVKWELKENNILYIKISHFNQDTADLFGQAIQENLGKNLQGVVLDLRNNPGGFLGIATDIAESWIKKGDIIVVEKFSQNNKNYYKSRGRAELAALPTVALINEGSASASEIVAGALQDHGLATIIGKQSFGKGSVQDLRHLSDGSNIKLTVAKWLTPNERMIDGEGIAPDIEVELTEEDYSSDRDPQLDKALEILND